jgi:hypothetical protein
MNKVVCIFLFLFFTSSWATERLPDHYPNEFKNEGILQEIESGGTKLTINATSYRVVNNVSIHTLSSSFGSINDLRKNMDIAFNDNDHNIIYEIWILPKGYAEVD